MQVNQPQKKIIASNLLTLDLREYATVALGNVMEENDENQALLAELKPIEAVQTDELSQLGLTPELLESGKVRINKTEL
jgi:hypothetical protein